MAMRPAWAVDARSLLLITIVLVGLAGSQLCVKAALARAGGVQLVPGHALSGLLRLASEPLLWAGTVCTVIAAVVWFEVLSRLSLSVAYPFLGFSYVLMLLAARLIFHEDISLPRLLGALLICVGVILVSRQS
jgi:drug/metabolite transporter (DMT)-like permease